MRWLKVYLSGLRASPHEGGIFHRHAIFSQYPFVTHLLTPVNCSWTFFSYYMSRLLESLEYFAFAFSAHMFKLK